MRKFIGIDKKNIAPLDIVSEIENFLDSNDFLDNFNELFNFYLNEKGKTFFIETLSETFFYTGVHNRMAYTGLSTTFHGSILESAIFFNELPIRVA